MKNSKSGSNPAENRRRINDMIARDGAAAKDFVNEEDEPVDPEEGPAEEETHDRLRALKKAHDTLKRVEHLSHRLRLHF